MTISANQSIKVKAIACAPSDEDRGLMFGMGASGQELALVTIDSSTTQPSGDYGTMLKAAFSDNFGGWVALVVSGTQPASPAALKATLSAAFSLKE